MYLSDIGEDIVWCSGIWHHIKTGYTLPARQPTRLTTLEFQNEDRARSLVRHSWNGQSSGPVDGDIQRCIHYRETNTFFWSLCCLFFFDIRLVSSNSSSYSLPNIEKWLSILAEAWILSTLCPQSGYHQITVAPADHSKAAFTILLVYLNINACQYGFMVHQEHSSVQRS